MAPHIISTKNEHGRNKFIIVNLSDSTIHKTLIHLPSSCLLKDQLVVSERVVCFIYESIGRGAFYMKMELDSTINRWRTTLRSQLSYPGSLGISKPPGYTHREFKIMGLDKVIKITDGVREKIVLK